MSRLPLLIASFAARLLPARDAEWGRAMVAETAAISSGSAWRFALGCLAAAIFLKSKSLIASENHVMTDISRRPRLIAICCAVAAILLGFAYMAAAGAPARYYAVNAGAFLLGLLALGALKGSRFGPIVTGLFAVALAGCLLAVSLTGVSAEGVTRWVRVGGVLVQPSLILVPVLLLGFLHARNALSALALVIAALALALQPDRAMAGALVAGLLVVAASRRGWLAFATLGAAAAALAVTLLRADPSPAVPFVDQILFTAFQAHSLAGLAVWAGSVLLLVPAFVGISRDPDNRTAYAAFGAIWLTVIAAALLGNFPTPLVGYGGSAVLGYLVSILGLPPHAQATSTDRLPSRDEASDQKLLRLALS